MMDYESLRARQSVLKQGYRDAPQTALMTLRADATVGVHLQCNVMTHTGTVTAGLHPAAGGDGMAACSGDMLLQALVACTGVTLSAVAKALGITLRSGQLAAEGDLDFRGTLGVSKEAPVGFQQIRLRITLDCDATEEQQVKLLELTERYCVVYQTLRGGVAVEVSCAYA
jgi:uncharacterized OsmC-like protein